MQPFRKARINETSQCDVLANKCLFKVFINQGRLGEVAASDCDQNIVSLNFRSRPFHLVRQVHERLVVEVQRVGLDVLRANKECTAIRVVLLPATRTACHEFTKIAIPAPLPTFWDREGDFVKCDFGQGLFRAKFPDGDEPGFFGLDAVEELARGFHVRVGGAPVGGQLARNRLLQDGLLELGQQGLLVTDFCDQPLMFLIESLFMFQYLKLSFIRNHWELDLTQVFKPQSLAHCSAGEFVDLSQARAKISHYSKQVVHNGEK